MEYEVVDTAAEAAEIAGTGVRPWVLEDSLGLLTTIAARQFGRAMHERLVEHGASIGQWPVLLRLWQEDGLTHAELSRRAAIEPPTLTRTIERMCRAELVKRSRNPDDRREVRVFLTARGKALRDRLIPEAAAVNGLATEGMSEAEIETLRALLRRVILNLFSHGYSFEDGAPANGNGGRRKAQLFIPFEPLPRLP